jgi:hypothetical protein
MADDKQLARLDLPAPPVFDGLAAAGGELFLMLEGGVSCVLLANDGRFPTDPVTSGQT